MSYITTGERIGYKRGRVEGEQRLILRLLSRRFGELLPQVRARVESMNSTQLKALAEALLDFTNIDDLNNWLQEH